MKAAIYLILIFSLTLFIPQKAKAQTQIKNWWPETDASIKDAAMRNGKLYIGGDFTRLYHQDSTAGYGAPIDTVNGTVIGKWAQPNGVVNVAIPDGKKGYFIGGGFNMVGDSLRLGIAHLDSSGKVSSMLKGFGLNNAVSALALAGDTLFIGGNFTGTGAFSNICSVSGQIKKMPIITGEVNCAVSDGSGGWFIGGKFTKVGEVNQTGLAHIDANGNLINWNPGLGSSSQVKSLLLSGNTLYVGGVNLYFFGVDRTALASINVITGALNSWYPVVQTPSNPGPSNSNVYVNAMIKSGNTLYIGGSFSHVGSSARNNLAAIDLTSGSANGWQPSCGVINTMVLIGNALYVGGDFSNLSGREYLAAFNTSTGSLTSWNPTASARVRSMIYYNGLIYAGGDFTVLGGQPRNYIGALDVSSGNATSWNPNLNNVVYTLTFQGADILAGGDFTQAGLLGRPNICKIDTQSAVSSVWNIYANKTIKTIAISGTNLFAAGSNALLSNNTKSNITAIQLSSNTEIMPTLTVNGSIRSMYTLKNELYIGGDFTNVNGLSRDFLASVSTITGNTSSWNPVLNSFVQVIKGANNKLYVAGDFSSINSQARSKIASFDLTTGALSSWSPSVAGSINAVLPWGNTVYIGGSFTSVNGNNSCKGIAALDSSTAAPKAWYPQTTGTVHSIGVSGNTVYAGGLFTTIAGNTRQNFAAISASTGQLNVWYPKPNAQVNCIVAGEGKVYVGGSFSLIGGQRRNYVAEVDTLTGLATPWLIKSTDMFPSVVKLEIYQSKLIIDAGVRLNGVLSNRISIIDINTESHAFADLNPSDYITDMAIADHKLYVTGLFNSIGGTTRNGVAAIDLQTGFVTSWNPPTTGSCLTVAVKDSTVYIGGTFDIVGAQARNGIAALDKNTGVLRTFNPAPGSTGTNYRIDDICIAGNILFASGIINGSFGGRTNNQALVVADCITGIAPPNLEPYGFSAQQMLSRGNQIFLRGAFNEVALTPLSPSFMRNGFAQINVEQNSIEPLNYAAFGTPDFMVLDEHLLYVHGSDGYGKPYLTVTEIDLPCPKASFLPQTSQQICQGDTITFSTNYTAFVKLQWLKNNLPIPGKTEPICRIADSGSYRLLLTDTVQNCSDTSAAVVVAVKPRPVAVITYSQPTTFCQGGSVTLNASTGSGLTYSWLRDQTIVSGQNSQTYAAASAGTYQSVITNSGNCTDTSTGILVSVNPKPVTSVISGSTNVNLNSTETYSVDSTTGSSYEWHITGGNQVSGSLSSIADILWTQTGSGMIKVVETNGFACKGDTVSKNILILGTDSLLLEKDSIIANKAGGNYTLGLMSNRSWNVSGIPSWINVNKLSGTGNDTLIFVVSSNDSTVVRMATVTVTAGIAVENIIIMQDFNTGISEQQLYRNAFALKIYPNPASTQISVKGLLVNPASLTDITGKFLMHIPSDGTYDISSLKPGLYFISTKDGAVKFVKE